MQKLPERQSMTIDAPLWKRAGAFLFDILLLDITVFYPFRKIIEGAAPDIWNINYTLPIILTIAAISMLAISYFYFMERHCGQTAGKMLFGLHVISTEKDPSAWQYLLRSVFLIPFFPFLILWIADPLYLLFSKEGQKLTEKLGKTKVIEKIYW